LNSEIPVHLFPSGSVIIVFCTVLAVMGLILRFLLAPKRRQQQRQSRSTIRYIKLVKVLLTAIAAWIAIRGNLNNLANRIDGDPPAGAHSSGQLR